jgi:hypothetical protein
LGIHLSPEWTPVLSFLLFGSLLTIGQVFKFKTTIKNQPNVDKYPETSFRLKSWRTLFCLVLSLAIGFATLISAGHFAELLPIPAHGAKLIISVALFAPSVAVITLFAKQRLHAALSAFFISTFFVIITLNQLLSMEDSGALSASTALAMSWILPVFLLSVAPAKAVGRRLIFLAIGLLLLIALNELSKLGLDLTAPKLQG